MRQYVPKNNFFDIGLSPELQQEFPAHSTRNAKCPTRIVFPKPICGILPTPENLSLKFSFPGSVKIQYKNQNSLKPKIHLCFFLENNTHKGNMRINKISIYKSSLGYIIQFYWFTDWSLFRIAMISEKFCISRQVQPTECRLHLCVLKMWTYGLEAPRKSV